MSGLLRELQLRGQILSAAVAIVLLIGLGNVWGRRRGLRRPSKKQAIQKFSEEEETKLMQHYIGLGLSRGEWSRGPLAP